MEEIILDSLRIPFIGRTLVDEEQLLELLDLVRINLPEAFREAEDIIRYKDEIFLQAEQYAQEIIDDAERRADEIVDEIGIVRRAELEAKQIRQETIDECKALHSQTIAEIEQMHSSAQQDVEQMRQMALAQSEEIQNGADAYADRVLKNIEQQLNDMLQVIRNGRQQLHNDAADTRTRQISANPSPRRSPKK